MCILGIMKINPLFAFYFNLAFYLNQGERQGNFPKRTSLLKAEQNTGVPLQVLWLLSTFSKRVKSFVQDKPVRLV